jgi:hypothetical protein
VPGYLLLDDIPWNCKMNQIFYDRQFAEMNQPGYLLLDDMPWNCKINQIFYDSQDFYLVRSTVVIS